MASTSHLLSGFRVSRTTQTHLDRLLLIISNPFLSAFNRSESFPDDKDGAPTPQDIQFTVHSRAPIAIHFPYPQRIQPISSFFGPSSQDQAPRNNAKNQNIFLINRGTHNPRTPSLSPYTNDRMNYDVPNYVKEDDQFTAAINAATSAALSAALTLHDPGVDVTSELVWEKGPVEQRVTSCKASRDAELQPVQFTVPKTLFMDENEMATWLLSSPEDFRPTASTTEPILLPPACGSMESAVDGTHVTWVDAATAMPWPVDSAKERKRKAARSSGSDTPSEEAEEEWDDKEGSSRRPPRRSRSAQVHNMSERRRRDRINEKMKALRALIPRCNKMDKASMLEDAIEYTKSLQMQHQMMSMGYTMFPMMYPSMQQYLSPIAAGAIRMSAEAGGTQPTHSMLPFSPTAQGSTPPGFASYLNSMSDFRALYPYPMASSEQARARGTDSMSQGSSALPSQCLNQVQTSNFLYSSNRQCFGYYPFTSSQNPQQENPESMDTGTSRETKLPDRSNG